MNNLTLLNKKEIEGIDSCDKLDVLKKYGVECEITDLALLTGACFDYTLYNLKHKTGIYYTKSSDNYGNVLVVNSIGELDSVYRASRDITIRPIINSPELFSYIIKNGYKINDDEIAFGNYSQYVPNIDIQKKLELEYRKGLLKKTGNSYTFDCTKYNDFNQKIQPEICEEYEYNNKRYIRKRAIFINRFTDYFGFGTYGKVTLSNNEKYSYGDYVWVEVSPVIWLIDHNKNTLVSKKGLLSGVRFQNNNKIYENDFESTDMNKFLNEYMFKDIFQEEKNITNVNKFRKVKKLKI